MTVLASVEHSSPDVHPVSLDQAAEALTEARRFVTLVRDRVRALIGDPIRPDPTALDRYQAETHGYAWMEATLATLEAGLAWARRLEAAGHFGPVPQLLFRIGTAEYLAQLGHGVAMAQDEVARPDWYDLEADAAAFLRHSAVAAVRAAGRGSKPRAELIGHLRRDGLGALVAGEDETVSMIRDQFRSYSDERIAPAAPSWHDRDVLIPIEIVAELAGLGVFGLTTPEELGGSGLGAAAMCVVTEELSRGYIGAGSLGTRAEIASELIRLGGTAAQQARYLPRIASGEILPAAVFTEPNTGSDLANLGTRAERHGGVYRIVGNKTWITHAARADLMLILARTGAAGSGHRGLTMFLAEKPRGTEADPFPAPGMSGGEIPVLGYRGMKEYELAFDGFEVPAENVLGGAEGQGFKQLMATFELARIQTAARAVGVAQNAFELGLSYACERVQFGRPIIEFPRVFGKLAAMAAEICLVRQLVAEAAGKKDTGLRCDVEAGMAKLIAARVAWSAADNALQIHGGNGYATEYPISRVLCDARILNIFEGAAEIQAQIIARGLLGRN